MKQAQPQDFEIIMDMARNFHIEDGHPLKARSEALIQKLLQGSELGQINIIYDQDSIAGYMALCFTASVEFGGTVMILDDFYLKPAFRNKGLGEVALRDLLRKAREMQVIQIFLEVERANERALKFYEKLGFKIRERNMMSLDIEP